MINKFFAVLTYLFISFSIFVFASLAFTWFWNESMPSMFSLPRITNREGFSFLGALFIGAAFLPIRK